MTQLLGLGLEPTLAEASQGRARLLAGGSDLLGELKEDIVAYEQLISLAGCTALRHIQERETGLQLGALVTLAELEYDSRLPGAPGAFWLKPPYPGRDSTKRHQGFLRKTYRC